MTRYILLFRINDYWNCVIFGFGCSHVLIFISFWRIRPDDSGFSFTIKILASDDEL
jgi:hypothetical protein